MGKFKDLTGKTFGRLTVLERVENIGKYTCWRCRCSCGAEIVVRAISLKSGLTQSCGCLQKERTSAASLQDLTGQTFGRLTVLERAENIGKCVAWLCRCDCGAEKIVRGADLRRGKIQSCGCLARELTIKRSTTHGMRHTSVYENWLAIKQRCCNPKHKDYDSYGGRGIKVCDRWLIFENFYEDVSKLEHFGEKGYSLDRIDNDGDYEPGNVRFATQKEQNRNQRRNIKVEYNGVEMCLKDAAKLSGFEYDTLRGRYHRGDRGEKLFRPLEKGGDKNENR